MWPETHPQLSYHATQLEPAVSSEFTLHPSKRPKKNCWDMSHVRILQSPSSPAISWSLVLWHPIFWVPYNKHDDRLPISSMTQLWSETSGGSAASTGRPSESSIRGRSSVDEFNHRIKINSKSRSNMIELIEPTKTGDGSDGPNKIDWHRTWSNLPSLVGPIGAPISAQKKHTCCQSMRSWALSVNTGYRKYKLIRCACGVSSSSCKLL
jgi:hypothetical protein